MQLAKKILIYGPNLIKSVLYEIYSVFYDVFSGKKYSGQKDGDDVNQGYQATKPHEIRKVLSDLDVSGKTIVDIGSGKGLFLAICSKFPFKKIYGIEIDSTLYEISQQNLCHDNISIFNGDVLNFDQLIWDEIDIYYFYNPFECGLFKKVYAKIKESFARNQRIIIIIYNNPICEHIIKSDSMFRKIADYDFFFSSVNTVVYRIR